MQGTYAANQITGIVGVDDVVSGKQVRDVSTGLYKVVDKAIDCGFADSNSVLEIAGIKHTQIVTI